MNHGRSRMALLEPARIQKAEPRGGATPRVAPVRPLEEFLIYMRQLQARGGATAIPASEASLDEHGRPISASFFPVRKSDLADRGICNRVPQNAWEGQLPMPALPHGSQFCQVALEPHECLRLSSEGAPAFFTLLRLPPSKVRRNCVGPVFSARRLRDSGMVVEDSVGDEVPMLLARTRQPMGDLNSCAHGQQAHESRSPIG